MNRFATDIEAFPDVRPTGEELLTRSGGGGRARNSGTSLLDSATIPEWEEVVLNRLVELCTLPEDWDTYGGSPVTREVAEYSLALLRTVMKAETRAPDLVPLPQGGLQMEWHDPNLDFEITIEEPGFASVWIVSPTHPDGKGMSRRYDFTSGLEPIQQLSEEA
jgi:hypothetical protein